MLFAYGPALAVADPVATPGELLRALFDDAWNFELDENPLAATYYGDRRADDRLPEATLAAAERRKGRRLQFRAQLGAIDQAALSPAERTNSEIFEWLLASEIEDDRFRAYLLPITNRTGFHLEFPELPRQVPLATAAELRNYIARLSRFDTWARQHIELMRAAVREKIVLPAVVLEGFAAPLEAQIVADPTASLLFAPFRERSLAVDEAEWPALVEAGRKAIAEHVVPGYREFLDFMREEYVPAARGTIACSALPEGRAYYRHLVRKHTTLDVSPEAVHEIGQREVARIRAEMETVIRQTGWQGDFTGFVAQLREDPKFYATTAEELLAKVSRILKRIDGELPTLFGKLPRTPYGVREVPAYIAPQTTTAYYQPPSGDGTKAGFYYVNTHNLKTRPLYEIEALSLHEAVPGHHLQIALQQEMTGVPAFRRFAPFTALVEGWGLYSERLGIELGFYQDPYSNFGRLSYEMWRACRLVVDTGMHALGWSREQAIEFMAANTALSRHNIVTEVDRYIAWPGQALAYKMGELEIRRLRGEAETRLGSRFDRRAFHDAVLAEGAVPLAVLARNIEAHIEARQAEPAKPNGD